MKRASETDRSINVFGGRSFVGKRAGTSMRFADGELTGDESSNATTGFVVSVLGSTRVQRRQVDESSNVTTGDDGTQST